MDTFGVNNGGMESIIDWIKLSKGTLNATFFLGSLTNPPLFAFYLSILVTQVKFGFQIKVPWHFVAIKYLFGCNNTNTVHLMNNIMFVVTAVETACVPKRVN